MNVRPLILVTARRHQKRDGFADEDIWHAWEHQIGTAFGTNEMRLVLGPDRSGKRLLELGMQVSGDFPLPIIHAMAARAHVIRAVQR